jgi:hypothetical protein
MELQRMSNEECLFQYMCHHNEIIYRLYVTIHSVQLNFQFQFHANGIYWWCYGAQFNWSYMPRSYGDLFRDEKLEVGILGWLTLFHFTKFCYK